MSESEQPAEDLHVHGTYMQRYMHACILSCYMAVHGMCMWTCHMVQSSQAIALT